MNFEYPQKIFNMFTPVTPNTENNLLSNILTISKIFVDIYNIFSESNSHDSTNINIPKHFILPNSTIIDYSCVSGETNIKR